MTNPERESSSGNRSGGSAEPPPPSGSATTNSGSSSSGGGVPSSAMAATTTSAKITNAASSNNNNNKSSATMATKPTNQQQTKRSASSTESEGYGKDRRAPPSRRSEAEEEEDDEEEDDEEDEEDRRAQEEEEVEHDDAEEDMRRSSESSGATGGDSGGGGGDASGVGTGSEGSSSAPHQSLTGSSSTSGSPVRRLPSMLRPPPSQQAPQPQQQPPQHQQAPPSSAMYGGSGSARQSLPHYYGGGAMGHVSPSAGGLMDGGRLAAQKRRLQPQPSHEYGSSPPPPFATHHHAPPLSQARALYEASQHHASSTSGSSSHHQLHPNSANTSVHRNSIHDDDDDDDNDDPLRFETRGSHGPRDEARYETWTSKQLRKKCSHLKLRGLKNVKKHVMVEALYRYYRNQRAAMGAGDGDNGDGGSGGGGGGAMSSSSGSHMRTSSGSAGHSNHNGHGHGGSSSARTLSNNRNDDNAIYGESYAQQQHRYEHSMNASSVSSNYHTNSSSVGMRSAQAPSSGARSTSNNKAPALNTNNLQQGRRSSPTSLTPPSRQTMRSSSGGGGSLPGSGAYHSTIDLEESKYDSLDNEVRITSEDVIRLVDVILSPEFVDRLSSELSRWQFWVDVREKYVSLATMNGLSSYGAARGLTALGGDHHSQHGERGGGGVGASSSVDNMRLPLTAAYVRPSAKWSSMQLWEMWKELTFAYTKTCFEFTAAGVDERNYIQFCEGRPDVYYLHQRLHARPDLLHLIKSNEYIEEKCSSDAASEHANMNAEKNAANALMGVSSPSAQTRPHKRFKTIVPAGSRGGDRPGSSASGGVSGGGVVQSYGTGAGATGGNYGSGTSVLNNAESGVASGTNAVSNANANAGSGSDGATTPQVAVGNNGGRPSGSNGGAGGSGSGGGGGGGPAQYLASNGIRVGTTISPSGQQEEGSTENSETTGEEGSLEKSNSNATSSDSTRREALAEQKYFGLLLQNFEAIFESLHNKKVLLAALRKDTTAPDHLIADLHDDIHVLSALKKDFRNKLRQALE